MAIRILQILGVVIATCEAHSTSRSLRLMRSEASHGHHSAKIRSSTRHNDVHRLHSPKKNSTLPKPLSLQQRQQILQNNKRARRLEKAKEEEKEKEKIRHLRHHHTEEVNQTHISLRFINTKKVHRDEMMRWMQKRVCSGPCGLKFAVFWEVENECKTKCLQGFQAFREASENVRPSGVEQPIGHPEADASTMRLHTSSDKTDYDQMLFAGGVKHDGKTSFVARLCTHGCTAKLENQDRVNFYDSTLILGEIERHKDNQHRDAWRWKNASEHWVEHEDGHLLKGEYVGPEDPRMDVVDGSRFLTVGMTVSKLKAGCPADAMSPAKKVDIHQLLFVPIDNKPGHQTCRIHPNRIDPCSIQKNWASVVPRGSKDIYYVFSIWPLQVIRFMPKSCQAKFITEKPQRRLQSLLREMYRLPHGGTRYIFGGQVPEGDLFWSVGHTASPHYMPVLVALLVRNAAHPDQNPTFELVGVSCPIRSMSAKFTDPQSPADDGWEKHVLITTSIVDFDPVADVSTVTFQVHDKQSYHTKLRGVGHWLKIAHQEYKRMGAGFRCDQLH